MNDSGNADDRVILKPIENFDLVAAIVLDACGLTNLRMSDLFTGWHEDIKLTRLGREVFKIDYGNAVISGLLWELWKQSKHANLAISNQSILDQLRFLIGEAYFSEARDAAGPENDEEFCDSVRSFLNAARGKYYSGIIGCVVKAKDALTRRLAVKKSHEPLI